MTRSTALYSNNARTTLTSNILSTDTTLPVATSIGFPVPSITGDYFLVTLDDEVNVEIVRVGGIFENTFINCIRGQEGTVAQNFNSTTVVENRLTAGNIQALARLEDRLNNVASIDNLASPAETDGNSALCASTDAIGAPIIAVVNGTKWRFANYPDIIKTGVVGGGASLTSLISSNIGLVLTDTTPKIYLIQFTSGVNIGICRFINVITTNEISWTTNLPAGLAGTDTFEIARCISSWKAPTGGNAERIFFENDMAVWSDYSIPPGRNACSTGPVLINSGVTISIPSGSSWSIV